MNCAFDKEKLTAFYDGELDAAGKAEVERHISACSECLRDLGEIKSASLLVKELPRPRAPRSIAEGVSRGIAATGRVHSFSRARTLVLWATAAAAGLFIVANVIFLAGGPSSEPAARAARPAPMAPAMGALPAEGGEKKSGDALALKEEKAAGYRSEDRKELDRAADSKDAAPKAEPAKEAPAEAKERAGRPAPEKADAELAKAKAPGFEKLAEAPKPTAAAKPAAPPAPPAAAPAPDLQKRQVESAERARNQLVQGNRNEGQAAPPVVVNVSAPEIAKVRARVEELARRYAARADGERQLQQHSEQLKKAEAAPVARREAEGTLTLDLTPAEYAALKAEIEKATGAQLAFAGPADGRLRGADAPTFAGKGGEAENTQRAAPSGGGLARGPGAPNSDEARRKSADDKQATGDPKQAPSNNPKDPAQPADKNAQEAEARRLNQGETRIRIVLNFLEIPVAEKK